MQTGHKLARHLALTVPPLLMLLSALFLAGCGSDASEPPAAPPAPSVSVAEVVVRDVNAWEEFTGRLEAPETVEVRPRVTGYVEQVRYTEGGEVRQGDVLFVIDQRPYRAELARAEAELERARARVDLAQAEAARARKLLKARVISQEEHDQRVAADAQGRAE
ncbi:MAG: biotin/lipoyl-binding protein, partial [Chromatiaceae bacterium]